MRSLLLPVLIILFFAVNVFATHYRGGTFYWERLSDYKIRVYWRLSFELTTSWPEYYCENIGDKLEAEHLLALTCIDCGTNTTILSPLNLVCTAKSTVWKWSLLDGYVDYVADRQVYTMGFQTTGLCTDSSWIQLQNYGSGTGKCWSLLTKVDTTLRNDSPRVTAVLPVYRVRRGCKRVIDLNPIDINGDPTKCRWANNKECPSGRDSSDVDRVCGKATELTVLHEEMCQIEFITGENELEGWYAASVMIEDFDDKSFTKAKSTVPFQFLLDVTAPGSCVSPYVDTEKCSLAEPGELWTTEITATIPEGSDASTITEIQGSFPRGMTAEYVSGYGPGNTIVKKRLSFRPKREGIYVFSFSATDNNGVQSDAISGRLRVSAEYFKPIDEEPPEIVPELSTPAAGSVYEGGDQMWTLKFDSPVTRPEKKAFIRIKEIDSNKVIEKFNAIDPDVVIFSKEDPTLVHYPAPKNMQAGKSYFVQVDSGFAVISFKTPCGDSATSTTPKTIYAFDTPKPPKPKVECGDSYIKVRIPKAKVGNVPASELHLHDPSCKVTEVDANFYEIVFAYDECGTKVKRVSDTKTKFYNTIRDDPKPIYIGAPVTREKRKIEMQIICEMTGIGVSDVYFEPAAALKPKKYKATGQFKTYLKLYEDGSYTKGISGTAPVDLKERLYFAAHSTSANKDVAIDSCRAMAKHPMCTNKDMKYQFITQRCSVDKTITWFDHNYSEDRFSIDSFAFLQYGLSSEILVKCRIVTCKPGDSTSRCAELRRGDCPSRIHRSLEDEETDAFMTIKM